MSSYFHNIDNINQKDVIIKYKINGRNRKKSKIFEKN